MQLFPQLLMLGILLILGPETTTTAPSRPVRSNCTQTYGLLPLQRLMAGVNVLKKYVEYVNKTRSLQGNSITPMNQRDSPVIDSMCNLVILYELAKDVDLPLSELLHQNIEDGCRWVSTNIVTAYFSMHYMI